MRIVFIVFSVIYGIPAVYITICNFRLSYLHLVAKFLIMIYRCETARTYNTASLVLLFNIWNKSYPIKFIITYYYFYL